MSNFTKSIQREYDFDDDQVKVSMDRMKRKDAIKLSPYIKLDDEGNASMTFEDQMNFIDVAADMMPKYIKRMSGLTIEGAEVSIDNKELFETFLTEAYFMPLVSEIMGDLVQASFTAGKEEAKN